MVTDSRDCREILKKEYEVRASRNPKYSLRAFARFLGISQSRLSEIFAGKQGLSRDWAEKIADRLGFGENEKQYLCDLAEAKHARSSIRRRLAQARIAAQSSGQESTLSADAFQVISDWYHFGITELAQTRDFRSDPAWIAKKLDIEPTLAKLAIERLVRLGLLVEDEGGRLRADDAPVSTTNGIPSEAIRKFHSQVLAKASEAIYSQTVKERTISTSIIPFHAKNFEDAEQLIRKFRKSFSGNFDSKDDKDSVYCLSVQFFRLDQKTEGVA